MVETHVSWSSSFSETPWHHGHSEDPEPVGQIMSGPRATQLHGSDLEEVECDLLGGWAPRYRKLVRITPHENKP